MKYVYNAQVAANDISNLREAVGWNRLEGCYQNPRMTSFCHIAAYEKDQLVGFVDSVSNGVTDAYIQDLMVHPDFQGKGIGTELMNRMIALLKEKQIFMISVIYEESLKEFYRRFGFYEMLSGQLQTYDLK